MSILRSSLAIALSVLGIFALFHLVAFPLFRNSADIGPANQSIQGARAAFLALFAALIASSLVSGILVGRLTRAPWMLVIMVAVPPVLILGLFSFYLLEFLNACEIDGSLIVDSRC